MKRHFVAAGHATGFEINKQRKVSSNPGETYAEPRVYEEKHIEDVQLVCEAVYSLVVADGGLKSHASSTL